jgi:hypothetical protein
MEVNEPVEKPGLNPGDLVTYFSYAASLVPDESGQLVIFVLRRHICIVG